VFLRRPPGDLVFVDELAEWAGRPRAEVIQCVDPGGQTPERTGEIGFRRKRRSSQGQKTAVWLIP
jgi:hypothetical protein